MKMNKIIFKLNKISGKKLIFLNIKKDQLFLENKITIFKKWGLCNKK